MRDRESDWDFVVNGRSLESKIIESVFLSPAVEEISLNDSRSREFSISD
jgi:hypothetical protein